MEFLGKRITWKSHPYVLRFFETTWAVMVAYPAGQIAESGLKEAVSSDKSYFIFYAVITFGFSFLLATPPEKARTRGATEFRRPV